MISSAVKLLTLMCLLLLPVTVTNADGPQDNSFESVRQIPPPGIELSQDQQATLKQRLETTAGKIKELRSLKNNNFVKYLPDVEVLYRAVDQALRFQEMFSPNDYKDALELLDLADNRAGQIKEGKADWTRQTGLVIRGYRSFLDDTVQPYALEIAADYDFDHPRPVRCDIWFHGRGEKSLELQFLSQHKKRGGEFPPSTGMVLHPFGRYSNAFKLAGEVDVLEALEDVQKNYRIDEDRIAVRGFSMGGAGAWLFAVHYADRWFAASPGAGFSETPEFLKIFQGETLNPPWYEEKLWRMHDCNHWVENLRQLPTVAYSGEIDKQKQAADVMEAAAAKYNMQLTHIIGPQTAHKIHPESNLIIRKKLDSIAELGRNRFPAKVHLTTFTLKYNRMFWVMANALREHWEKSTIDAEIVDAGKSSQGLELKVEGVTDFSIDFPAGYAPFDVQVPIKVIINQQELPAVQAQTDRSLSLRYALQGNQWSKYQPAETNQLVKKHNLQGPIDDALMLPFLFVKPTGQESNAKLQSWVDAEMNRAIKEWRRHMRGDVRIKNDTEVKPEDMAAYNLIVWGTPESNQLIKQLSAKLPVSWNESGIKAGDQQYARDHHALSLIYPNPQNAERYIVFNSGFTFREYDYLNNARQTPKLPDWAIIDVNTPPNARWPGKIVEGGFFDERWGLKVGKK